MKKRISTVLLVLIFILGLFIMLYPTISNYYNQKMNSYIVTNYVESVSMIDEDAYALYLEEALSYNESLHSIEQEFIAGEAEDQSYIDTLDVLDGIMGYLVIDKIDVNLPIYHGTDESVLQVGVGHLEGSSLPTGEVGNHTVLTGHTGLPSAELLTNLTEMEIGDTFEINVLDEVYTYEVFNIVTIEPSEIDDLERVEDKDIVTLVTCTPYGINSHRLLVQGERIEVEEEDTPVVQAVESDSTSIWETIDYYMPYATLMIIYFLLLIILVLSLLLRNAKKETRALKNITKKDEKKQKKINKLHQKFLKYDKKWQVKNQ
ncbi:MAG: class C sortase, partial [Eubacteriales bacterium]